MYVGLTGGKHKAFQHFLNGNYFAKMILHITFLSRSISMPNKIWNDHIKCLHLLHCLAETNLDILSTIRNVFQDGIIDLNCQSLIPNDIRILVTLLMRVPKKKWEKIDLSDCGLDISSCYVFWEMYNLQTMEFTIKAIDISNNHNLHWESVRLICELLKFWHTEELAFSVHSLLDATATELIANFQCKLCQYLRRPKWHYDSKSMTNLQIIYKAEYCCAVAVAVTFNFESQIISIVCTEFHDCKLDDHLIANVVAFASAYIVDNFQCSYLTNERAGEILSTLSATFKEIKFISVHNLIHTKSLSKLFALLNSQSINVQFNQDHCELHKFVECLSGIMCGRVLPLHVGKEIVFDFMPNDLNIKDSPLLKHIKNFHVSNKCIGNDTADGIAAIFENTQLERLTFKQTIFKKANAIKILKSLQNNSSLKVFNMNDIDIDNDTANEIGVVLSQNVDLQELHLNNTNLQADGIIKISKSLQNASSLTEFNIMGIGINDEAADAIATTLSHNTKLEKLNISQNNLQSEGLVKIAKALQDITSLLELNLGGIHIY